MKQKWKPMQFVEISMHEIFAFQDRLDKVRDTPEKVWDIVDDFFWECENQLELDPNFIKELNEVDIDKDFVALHSVEELDDLFDNTDDPHEKTAQDYINYIMTQIDKKRYEIPFLPRHDF